MPPTPTGRTTDDTKAPTAAAPVPCRIVVCRDCCCGSPKVTGVDHAAQTERCVPRHRYASPTASTSATRPTSSSYCLPPRAAPPVPVPSGSGWSTTRTRPRTSPRGHARADRASHPCRTSSACTPSRRRDGVRPPDRTEAWTSAIRDSVSVSTGGAGGGPRPPGVRQPGRSTWPRGSGRAGRRPGGGESGDRVHQVQLVLHFQAVPEPLLILGPSGEQFLSTVSGADRPQRRPVSVRTAPGGRTCCDDTAL